MCFSFFFFNDTATTEIYTLSLHDALPIWALLQNRDVLLLTVSYLCMNYVFYLLANWCFLYLVQERHITVLESGWLAGDRKSTRLNSSHLVISYAVFCLKKKTE